MAVIESEPIRTHDTLHLGCGKNIRLHAHNVDVEPLDGVDEVVDLNQIPWPWDDESWQLIVAEHVFEHLTDIESVLRECERVLVPGGQVTVVVPMGVNAIADPDHEHVWTWQTPEFYCGERHWDTDVGLTVAAKKVNLHSHHRSEVISSLHRMLWEWQISKHGAGEWCFGLSSMSGEFTITFEKPEADA